MYVRFFTFLLLESLCLQEKEERKKKITGKKPPSFDKWHMYIMFAVFFASKILNAVFFLRHIPR